MPRNRAIILALLAAAFFLNSGMRMLAANWLKLRHLRGEIAELKNRESGLVKRQASAGRGSLPVEKAARIELGMLKSDEIEYRFSPPNPDDKNE